MAVDRKGQYITNTSAKGVMRCNSCGNVVRESLLSGRWWCDSCDSDPTVSTLTSNVHKGTSVTTTKRQRK